MFLNFLFFFLFLFFSPIIINLILFRRSAHTLTAKPRMHLLSIFEIGRNEPAASAAEAAANEGFI